MSQKESVDIEATKKDTSDALFCQSRARESCTADTYSTTEKRLLVKQARSFSISPHGAGTV
jgi:hypothetical protein